MPARTAWRAETHVGWRPRSVAWWTGVLFMVGSFCFALGAFPGFSAVVPTAVVGIVFFVGSVFFTSAAVLQLVQSPRGVAWVASMIQLVGTLWFNINTFDAMQTGLSVKEQNLRVWTPDFIGSICFLVSSWLAVALVCRRPWCVQRDRSDWWIAAANLVGSIFFMLSALAAFVRPSTDSMLDASLANSGTFLGAVCFFWAARLQITRQ
jgi:YrhK-like protein